MKINKPWIASPAIHYHLGVDGLSVWLVVLTGFLAPVGVLASWNAIETRTKEFYFLFLLQRTAMIGVFVALECSSTTPSGSSRSCPWQSSSPCSDATAGAATAALPSSSFSTPLFRRRSFWSRILWLYARTGTFDYVELQASLTQQPGLFTPQALAGFALLSSSPSLSRSRSFRCTAGSATSSAKLPPPWRWSSPASSASIRILRFNLGLFPAQARRFAHWMISLAVIGILYGALVALVQNDLKRLARLRAR